MLSQQQFGGFQQFPAPQQQAWVTPQTTAGANPWAIPQTTTAAPATSSWNLASLQQTLPAAGGSSFSASSAAGGSVFIPKKKQAAAGGGDFPALGVTPTDAAKDAPKKEPEDVCYGKPKEFFIYDFNPQTNTCFCTTEQLSFVSIYYTDHYFAPIDILMWLYDMAEYRDALNEQKELEAIYGAKPKTTAKAPTTTAATVAGKTATKGKQVKKQESSEEEYDEEESTFGNNYKASNKKKPVAAAPTKPVFGGKQLTEAQKEEQRKKKL